MILAKVSKKLLKYFLILIEKDKVKIIFKPAPGAEKVTSPGRENLEVTVGGGKNFSEILNNLKKKIEYFRTQKTFLFYVSNTFAVYPSACIRDIYENFGSGGALTINYSVNEAWG